MTATSYPNDRHYRTARATVSCAEFKAGQFVSVEFDHELDGVVWFLIRNADHGPLRNVVAYPKHHLTEFCL